MKGLVRRSITLKLIEKEKIRKTLDLVRNGLNNIYIYIGIGNATLHYRQYSEVTAD